MSYTTSVELNRPEIYALLGNHVRRIGQRVQNVARRRAPKNTGKMAATITVVVGSAPGFVFADIGSFLSYAIWQHEGTGIYAGRGFIRPKRARFMKFKPGRPVGPLQGGGKFTRGASAPGYVYARKVRGIPPSPFLTSALSDVCGGFARIRFFGRSRGGARRR